MNSQKSLKMQELSQPVTRLPFINNFSAYLPEQSTVAGICYSDLGRDSSLHLVNVETLKEEKHYLPDGVNCGYLSFVKGGDGNLYFSSGDGCVYRFDPLRKAFNKVVQFFDKHVMLIGTHRSASGRIYAGTYPEGSLCEYDPSNGQKRIVPTMPRENLGLYCVSFIELPNGKILALVVGSRPGLCLYDPGAGECHVVYEGDCKTETRGFFNGYFDDDRIIVNYFAGGLRLFNWKKCVFEGTLLQKVPESLFKMERVGDAFYCCGYPSRKMYKLEDGAIAVVSEDFPNGNFVNNFHDIGNGEFACIGDNGLFMKFGLDKSALRSSQLDNVSEKGMGLQFLYKVPSEEYVIGAHFIDSQMFRINLADGKTESSLNKVVPYLGQINCGTALDGKFFLGSYTKAVVSVYDWRKPFAYGNNPELIGEIGEEQNRPIRMVNDGRSVYITTGAEYGTLGGAITVLDPATKEMTVYRNFVKDQNPTSGLFYINGKNLLAGATDIYGDCQTAAPTASTSVVFLWSPAERKTVHSWSPWDIPHVTISDISPSGICIGFKNPPGQAGGEYFLWDVASDAKEIKKWPVEGIMIGGLFMNDREFYGATEHGLFVFDIKSGDFQQLTQTTKLTGSYCTKCFTKLNDAEFLFDIQGVKVMKAEILNSTMYMEKGR